MPSSEETLTLYRMAIASKGYMSDFLVNQINDLLENACQQINSKTLTELEAYGIIAQIASIKNTLENLESELDHAKSMLEEEVEEN